jgi:hypothetical protein
MRPGQGFNRHHILFNRTMWESNRVARDLREESSLIIPIAIETHRELHKNVSVVPLVDNYMLSRAARRFEGRVNDPLRTMQQLATCIEIAMDFPKVTDIEYRLGALAVDAIEAQIPYIKFGMMRGAE